MTQTMGTSRRLFVGYAGAVGGALALFLLGMSWFLNAENNLLAAGVGPLTGRQQAFGYIKAMENTIAAILIAVFVLRRDRVGTSLVLLAAVIVPIGDVIAILRVGYLLNMFLSTHPLLLRSFCGVRSSSSPGARSRMARANASLSLEPSGNG